MGDEIVYDRLGRIIARYVINDSTTLVLDAEGAFLGQCSDGRTFNKHGVVIAYSEIPGLLVPKEDV